jgi:hypothetical protein
MGTRILDIPRGWHWRNPPSRTLERDDHAVYIRECGPDDPYGPGLVVVHMPAYDVLRVGVETLEEALAVAESVPVRRWILSDADFPGSLPTPR